MIDNAIITIEKIIPAKIIYFKTVKKHLLFCILSLVLESFFKYSLLFFQYKLFKVLTSVYRSYFCY